MALRAKFMFSIWKRMFAAVICGLAINIPVSTLAGAADMGFQFTFGSSFGASDQNDINDKYLDEYARPAGLFDDRVTNPFSLLGEIGYRLPPNHSIHIGLSYTNGKTSKGSRLLIIDEAQNVIGSMTDRKELRLSAIIPQVRMKYALPWASFTPFLSLGACYAYGEVSLSDRLTVDSSGAEVWRHEDDFTANGWGWLVTAGAARNIAGRISFGAEAGYRRLITGDLEDKTGNVWRFDGSDPAQAIRLDFSGWFLLGTISVDL